jgi:hypothetical protein
VGISDVAEPRFGGAFLLRAVLSCAPAATRQDVVATPGPSITIRIGGSGLLPRLRPPTLLPRAMLSRVPPTGFIEPCLPSPADKPPSGAEWVHEIKHDGYRMMAQRDPVGIRLLTRNGHDWAPRYPLIVEAVNALKVRSCLIDS